MSSRSSIILTDDNEHWYEEISEYETRNGEEGPVIYIEFENGNAEVITHTKDTLYLKILPGSHMYRIIKSMQFLNLDDKTSKGTI